jgi:hypothetical protein
VLHIRDGRSLTESVNETVRAPVEVEGETLAAARR